MLITSTSVNTREPTRRASSLYHLGTRVRFEARRQQHILGEYTEEQLKVLNIFLTEVERCAWRARLEAGYASFEQSHSR